MRLSVSPANQSPVIRRSCSPWLNALETLSSLVVFPHASISHCPSLIYLPSQNLKIFPLSTLTKQGAFRSSRAKSTAWQPREARTGHLGVSPVGGQSLRQASERLGAWQLSGRSSSHPRARAVHSDRWAWACQPVPRVCAGKMFAEGAEGSPPSAGRGTAVFLGAVRL